MRSTVLLLLVSFGAIGDIFLDSPIFLGAEIIGMVGFFTLEFKQLSKMARALVLLSVALAAHTLYAQPTDLSLLVTATHRAAFMSFFLTSLSFLQFTAARSPLILRSGQILVQQRPGRRYLVLTFGAALFGFLLNLGSVGLLGTMIAKGVTSDGDAEGQRIATIRRKRMTLAMLRGFGSLPMWSPITVTLAILVAAIPSLSWGQMILFSGPLAISFLMIGWALDRRAYPRRNLPDLPDAPSLLGLLPLITIVIFIPSAAYLGALVLGTSMITGLLILLPLISMGWLGLQARGTGQPPLRSILTQLHRGLLPGLPNTRTEIALFAASAFIGVMIAGSLNTDTVGATILALGLSAQVVLVLSAWLVVLLSIAGVSPIISVTILAGTLPNLQTLAIDPVALGVMLLAVWSLSVNVTPFSASVRMSARLIDQDPLLVGLRWNSTYGFVCLVVLSAFLLFFQ